MPIRAREEVGVNRPVSVKPAASVILVREDGAVLWVRRGDELKFAGGFYAFPGGRVDVQDSGVPVDGGEALGAAEAPCVVAAARDSIVIPRALGAGRGTSQRRLALPPYRLSGCR